MDNRRSLEGLLSLFESERRFFGLSTWGGVDD
jgi:hypothetical protein